MKKGFTLAEVLITLAIIGVVAALTIPSVIVRTQQQEFKTAAKKAYSVLSQAVQLTEVKDGYTINDGGYFIEALIKNMNVVKVENMVSYNLPGAAYADLPTGPIYGEGTVFYTADGIMYMVSYMNSEEIVFMIDVNGQQGPSNIYENRLEGARCGGFNCDARNPDWPGLYLSDVFEITFNEGRSNIVPYCKRCADCYSAC